MTNLQCGLLFVLGHLSLSGAVYSRSYVRIGIVPVLLQIGPLCSGKSS